MKPKPGYVDIPLDDETWRVLEKGAKQKGLTVDEFAVELIRDFYEIIKAENKK